MWVVVLANAGLARFQAATVVPHVARLLRCESIRVKTVAAASLSFIVAAGESPEAASAAANHPASTGAARARRVLGSAGADLLRMVRPSSRLDNDARELALGALFVIASCGGSGEKDELVKIGSLRVFSSLLAARRRAAPEAPRIQNLACQALWALVAASSQRADAALSAGAGAKLWRAALSADGDTASVARAALLSMLWSSTVARLLVVGLLLLVLAWAVVAFDLAVSCGSHRATPRRCAAQVARTAGRLTADVLAACASMQGMWSGLFRERERLGGEPYRGHPTHAAPI